jgi:uridine kinase
MTPRRRLIVSIAEKLPRPQDRVALIGIDGVDGAGKSVFADELARELQTTGATVVRASIDSFHNPRDVRYRQGKESPSGFFEDSFDYAALRREIFDPLSTGGDGRIRTAVFDYRIDAPTRLPQTVCKPGSVLVFDGIFLLRPELRGVWDASIFLHVDFAETFKRMAVRDGCPADPYAPQNRRYVEGQTIYLQRCRPQDAASFVIDNTNLESPGLLSP